MNKGKEGGAKKNDGLHFTLVSIVHLDFLSVSSPSPSSAVCFSDIDSRTSTLLRRRDTMRLQNFWVYLTWRKSAMKRMRGMQRRRSAEHPQYRAKVPLRLLQPLLSTVRWYQVSFFSFLYFIATFFLNFFSKSRILRPFFFCHKIHCIGMF